MGISLALAGLAGGLAGTAQGLDAMDTGLEKKKQLAFENKLKLDQARREQALLDLQKQNQTFRQDQVARGNVHQDLFDIAPGHVIPDALQPLIQKYGLQGDTQTRPGVDLTGFTPTAGTSNALMPSLQPRLVRSPTGAEAQRATLAQSELGLRDVQTREGQQTLSTQQTAAERLNTALQHIAALGPNPDYKKIDPLDFQAVYPGKTIDQVFPQAAIDFKNATYRAPTILDYLGQDENGNPTQRLVPRVVGQEITQPPHVKRAAEKASETVAKGLDVSLTELQRLAHQLITTRGLAQVAKGTVEKAQAEAAMNAAMREYQTLRGMVAPTLARKMEGRVTKQSSDAMLNGLADVRSTPAEAVDAMFTNLRNLAQIKAEAPSQVPHAIDFARQLFTQPLSTTPQTFGKGGGR